MPRISGLIPENSSDPPSSEKTARSENISYRILNSSQGVQVGESEVYPVGIEWYHAAEQELLRIRSLIRDDKPIDIHPSARISGGIVESLLEGDQLLARALSGQSGIPLIGNMVHVAIMAARLGMGLGWPREELDRLALAGLLHDIGMLRLPESLTAKTGKLSPQESEQMRSHPELGCETIRSLDPDYEWLAQAVLQEHERWDGQGYPKGLKEHQITEYARIIGIVDIFDALLNARPYRRRLLPHEAVREVLVAEKASFPSYVVKAFVHEFSLFPVGTPVRLNTGETAIVKQRNAEYPLRPVVEVRPTNGGGSQGSREIRLLDLSRTTLVHIVEVVDPNSP